MGFHEDEARLVLQLGKSFYDKMNFEYPPLECNFYLRDGDIEVDGLRLKIIFTPGHSPGSICIYWPDVKALFTGDLIFLSGVGVFQVPGGNGKKLKQSIEKIMELDIEYLLPGHGEIIIGKHGIQRNFELVSEHYFPILENFGEF